MYDEHGRPSEEMALDWNEHNEHVAPRSEPASTLTAPQGALGIDAPRVTVSEYAVSYLPADHSEYLRWRVLVAKLAPMQWAVFHAEYCLNRAGAWDPGAARPGDVHWLAEHCFDQDEALRRAAHAAATLDINGQTVADVLRRAAARA